MGQLGLFFLGTQHRKQMVINVIILLAFFLVKLGKKEALLTDDFQLAWLRGRVALPISGSASVQSFVLSGHFVDDQSPIF